MWVYNKQQGILVNLKNGIVIYKTTLENGIVCIYICSIGGTNYTVAYDLDEDTANEVMGRIVREVDPVEIF